MAITQFFATVRVRDASGTPASYTQYWTSAGVDHLENTILAAAGLAELFDTALDVKTEEVVAHVPLVLSGIKSSPVAGSNVSAGGLIEWANTPHAYSTFFPGWAKSLVSGDVLTYPAGFIATLDSTYLTAGGSGPFLADRYYNGINNIEGGRYVFRKFRKAMSRYR